MAARGLLMLLGCSRSRRHSSGCRPFTSILIVWSVEITQGIVLGVGMLLGVITARPAAAGIRVPHPK
jgi:hypothetical protein